MIPAVGSGSWPAARRTRSRSRSWNSATRPLSRQCPKKRRRGPTREVRGHRAPGDAACDQLDRVLRGGGLVVWVMGSAEWGWIVPDGLWEVVELLFPAAQVRQQDSGTANLVGCRSNEGSGDQATGMSASRYRAWWLRLNSCFSCQAQ